MALHTLSIQAVCVICHSAVWLVVCFCVSCFYLFTSSKRATGAHDDITAQILSCLLPLQDKNQPALFCLISQVPGTKKSKYLGEYAANISTMHSTEFKSK